MVFMEDSFNSNQLVLTEETVQKIRMIKVGLSKEQLPKGADAIFPPVLNLKKNVRSMAFRSSSTRNVFAGSSNKGYPI
ncbi:hypothetical protein DX928_20080 [Bacillus swezeyi]|uniref:Uncharacterized protein n=1 Tax=Bacillus swezeyi TaxID=1925020 RepID=A0A5M8RYP6_9BACI|nr:hypothetical protein DX927_14670 [Bacillus swezeyi]KAA6473632.1 hypothetical protein DX928_20080 [Bacillus swezeyi]